MAAAFQQAIYDRVASATQTLTFPDSCTPGSILFCLIASESESGTPSCSDPTNGNWTQYGSTVKTGGSTWCALFYVINTASSALVVTCGFSGNSVAVGMVVEYTGQAAGLPVDPLTVIANILSTGSNGSYAFPTITTSLPDEQVILLAVDTVYNGGLTVVASGYTTQYSATPNRTGVVVDNYITALGTSSGTNSTQGTGGSSGNIGVVATIVLRTPGSTVGGFTPVGRFNDAGTLVGALSGIPWTNTNVSPVTVDGNVTTDQVLMTASLNDGLLDGPGKTLKLHAAGIYTLPAGSSTVEFKVKIGSLGLVDILTTAPGGAVTDNKWLLDVVISTVAPGSSATFEASGALTIDLGSLTTSASSVFTDTNDSTIGTLDSTMGQTIEVTVAFATNSASNVCTQRQMILTTIN